MIKIIILNIVSNYRFMIFSATDFTNLTDFVGSVSYLFKNWSFNDGGSYRFNKVPSTESSLGNTIFLKELVNP